MSAHSVPRIGWRRPWIPAHIRRRLLAGLLAGAAAILALTSMHPTAAPVASPPHAAQLGDDLGADQVAAPIRLVDPGVAALLRVGSYVDVLAATSSPTGSADDTQSPARVIAYGVRVLAVPATSATATSAGGSLVVLEVSRGQAQALAGAEAGGRLSVTLTRP